MAAVTAFEQAIAALAPVTAFRCAPAGITPLSDPPRPVPYLTGQRQSGTQMVPSEGVLGSPSLRLNGTDAYLAIPFFPLQEVAKITVFAVFSRPAGDPGGSNGWVILSCTQSGGWTLYLPDPGTSDRFAFLLQRGGNYVTVECPASQLLDVNFAIGTYDGRYQRLFLNGVKVDEIDHGSVVDIGHSTYDVPIFLGAEPDSAGTPTSSYGFTPVDIALAGFCDYGITEQQAADLWSAFTVRHALAGRATLDSGLAADRVVIAGWDRAVRGEVIPATDGSWAADVDAGDYLVTTVGPAGYQPITHGPVTAAAA